MWLVLVLIILDRSSSLRFQGPPRSAVDVFRLNAKGFGSSSKQEVTTQSAGPVSAMKQQVLVLNDDSQCVCGSKRNYASCCGIPHKASELGQFEPRDIIRARYSAYALGLGPFLIRTTHRTQRDYRIHFHDAVRDPAKAYKGWVKELESKNSADFEFLKFEFDDTVDPALLIPSDEAKGLQASAHAFSVIVRGRSSQEIVAFREVSTFVRDVQPDVSPGSSRGFGGAAQRKSKESAVEPCWYYQSGVVTTLSEDVARRLAADIPKYSTITTVQDRWEKAKE